MRSLQNTLLSFWYCLLLNHIYQQVMHFYIIVHLCRHIWRCMQVVEFQLVIFLLILWFWYLSNQILNCFSIAFDISFLLATSLLLLLLFIFLITDRFFALSINPSFSIIGVILVCVLPSTSVGLFLSTYLSARYLSFSIWSKIWDLTFSLANSSVCFNFLALQMAAWFYSAHEASASNSAIFSFSSNALYLIYVFPRELLDDLVFEELENFLELLPGDLFNPNKAGLFESSFFWWGRGVNSPPI